MTVKEFQVGMVGTNCFLAVNSETGEMLVIDPGDNADVIADYVSKKELHPKAVLLTHGHFDHCMAAQQLAEQYQGLLDITEEENEFLVLLVLSNMQKK